ncbi:MAG: carbohydrate transporter rane protein 2, family [Thermoleophilia bacterium]|jgi:multiple sugar transport system permease protein|nr:carbohydrate transporter rane protein 2, family [Thermoleophilia bacterium]
MSAATPTAGSIPVTRPVTQSYTPSSPTFWQRVRGLPWTGAGIVVLVLYCLFPFLWLVRLSMDPSASGAFLPATFTLKNYVAVFQNHDFLAAFMNSIIVSGSATVIAMAIGGSAAYALGRLPVPGKPYIMFAVLCVSMFPGISIVGPLFDMWRSIGLFDTKLGLIIPNVTFCLPMAIWFMSGFFRELPRDLEHAAYMDGATPFQAFRKVMLPLAAPGVFTSAILVFIATWNEFMFAMSFTATNQSRPIPAMISTFQGENSMEIPVGLISAASVAVMLPLLAMVMVFQRRIVSGLTAGGVKG